MDAVRPVGRAHADGRPAFDAERGCEAAAAAAARSARIGDGGSARRARARRDADRGGGTGARSRAEADSDPRPALALGVLFDARHAVVQLAPRACALRGAGLRRRPRAVPPAGAESLTP